MKKTRLHGEGCIYPDGKGYWVAEISLGKDINGKHLRARKKSNTQKQALKELAKLQSQNQFGSGGNPKYSPKSGYRYDGLYVVKNYWWEKSTDGPTIIRFLLQQLELNQNVETETKSANLELPPMGNLSPVRKASTSTSVSRDSRIAAWAKNLYKDSCQICGKTIITQIGTYSEGAHIKPLGKPHDGHDTTENMLCLCPNCHATFDFGMLVIDIKERTWTDLAKGINGALNINVNHKPDPNFADYHRQHIAGLTSENR